MDPRKKSPTKKQSSSQLTTGYLLIYNSVLTIGFVIKKFLLLQKNIIKISIVGHLFYSKQ